MADERQRQEEEGERADEPFDESPPVDPRSQQVGNSNARFFMPREDEPEDGEDQDADGDPEGDT